MAVTTGMAAEPLPADLPWHLNAALLLDGASLSELPRRIYEWAERPEVEPLYLGTRLAALMDVSPCLVAVAGPRDPVLLQASRLDLDECGYLLFSAAPWSSQINHLRWLMQVRAAPGAPAWLRLADPAVMAAMLDVATDRQRTSLLGPFAEVVLPDWRHGRWRRFQGPATGQIASHEPYQLSEQQLEALEEVSFRQVVARLDRYMQLAYPEFPAGRASSDRLALLGELATQAYDSGFCAEGDIQRYAGIFGLLGVDALETCPDLAPLLHDGASGRPGDRLEQAFVLAEGWAEIRARKGHA